MAFNNTNFKVLAYANSFTLRTYKTPDSVETMDETGYWNSTFDMVREGDMILATTTEKDGSEFGSIWMIDEHVAGGVVANQKNTAADVI